MVAGILGRLHAGLGRCGVGAGIKLVFAPSHSAKLIAQAAPMADDSISARNHFVWQAQGRQSKLQLRPIPAESLSAAHMCLFFACLHLLMFQ